MLKSCRLKVVPSLYKPVNRVVAERGIFGRKLKKTIEFSFPLMQCGLTKFSLMMSKKRLESSLCLD